MYDDTAICGFSVVFYEKAPLSFGFKKKAGLFLFGILEGIPATRFLL